MEGVNGMVKFVIAPQGSDGSIGYLPAVFTKIAKKCPSVPEDAERFEVCWKGPRTFGKALTDS